MNLNVSSYNCCSLVKNIDIVRKLTEMHDIVFLQETFITNDNIGILDFVNENCYTISVGALYSEKSMLSMSGRPMGGMACIWKKDSTFKVKLAYSDSDCMVIEVINDNIKCVFVNVYIRSNLGDPVSLNNYLENLSKLEEILNDYPDTSVFYIGDFNSDPFNISWNNLNNFITRNNLICYDLNMLDISTCTYVSYSNNQCKWLDHFIGRTTENIDVRSINVLKNLIGSDHLPVEVCISIPDSTCINSGIIELNNFNNCRIKWDALSVDQLQKISSDASSIQGVFRDFNVYKNCLGLGCNSSKCLENINKMYDTIVESVSYASSQFQTSELKKNKFKVIPGWNRMVKDLHDIAREQFIAWLEAGRPREGPLFMLMKETRSRFKAALNECKNNEMHERSVSFQNSFNNKDMKAFWGDIKKCKGKTASSLFIDGEVDVNKILNIFTDKFLINDLNNNSTVDRDLFERELDYKIQNGYKSNIIISNYTLRKLISGLNYGQGHDDINSKFLKYVDDSFVDNIVFFINMCYVHCFIPKELLKGDITPIVKNKVESSSDSGNYRPVMQSSCILKLIESHLLEYISEKVNLCNKQFGFKQGVSTAHACLLLKEAVNNYLGKKGEAVTCYIDFSKAFDRVNHYKLGRILIDKNVPCDIVKLLIMYFRNQTARINWNLNKGDFHNIESGVRQGGILSPFLFKLYIDDVLSDMSKLDVGCIMGISRLNVLAYADDVVLIADTIDNLEILYSFFKQRVDNIDLLINRTKTKCMIFNKSLRHNNPEYICLMGDKIDVVSSYKYLGNIIVDNLCDSHDIELKLQNFYKSFYSMYRYFNFLNLDTFLYIFNSYCMPSYGTELWFSHNIFNKQIFKVFHVAYSNALKRIVGVPRYYSSHFVANMCNQFLFNHIVSINQLRFFKRVLKTNNSIFILNRYFLSHGLFAKHVNTNFKNYYNVQIRDNDVDALVSRVQYVQNYERVI